MTTAQPNSQDVKLLAVTFMFVFWTSWPLTVLRQSEVTETASRFTLLLGSGGAQVDPTDRLPNHSSPVRVQPANGRLRFRVS